MAYARPNHGKAIWQLVNTITPYLGLWVLMVWMLNSGFSFWLVLPIMVVAAAFLVRIFIFFHDCCHGSFFRYKWLNSLVGNITGVLTFTPFEEWKYAHNTHHATAGDLDRRGAGDVWTITKAEYEAMTRGQRLGYRLARNPFVMLMLGPIYVFLISQRYRSPWSRKGEIHSIWITNLLLLAVLFITGFTIGFKTYILIQLPIMLFAGSMGIWLFYVQHQYEETYWAKHEVWDPFKAALEGSSFYRLPGLLQWFSGNIGFHHIHHLHAKIPNYNLSKCFKSIPSLQDIKTLTLRESWGCMNLKLWDENLQKLVPFRAASAQ